MKQIRLFAAFALALSLASCSSPTADTETEKETEAPVQETEKTETEPEETAVTETGEFTPEQIAFEYGEEESDGQKAVTLQITNHSDRSLIDFGISFRPTQGHTFEEVFHAVYGDEAEFSEGAMKLSASGYEIIEPGKSGRIMKIQAYDMNVYEYRTITPEIMEMLQPGMFDVYVPEGENKIVQKTFFSENGIWREEPFDVSADWNTWENCILDWLPEITGKDYSLEADPDYGRVVVTVYNADEAFFGKYKEEVLSSLPGLTELSAEVNEFGETTVNMLYYSDENMTKDIFLDLYKPGGMMRIIAASYK